MSKIFKSLLSLAAMFTMGFTANAVDIPEVTPAQGTVQDLSNIDLNFTNSKSLDGSEAGICVDDPSQGNNYTKAVVFKKDGVVITPDYTIGLDPDDYYKASLTFCNAAGNTETITDPGTYTIEFQEGAFYYYGDADYETIVNIPAFTLTYTIEGATPAYTWYYKVNVTGDRSKLQYAYGWTGTFAEVPADGICGTTEANPASTLYVMNLKPVEGYQMSVNGGAVQTNAQVFALDNNTPSGTEINVTVSEIPAGPVRPAFYYEVKVQGDATVTYNFNLNDNYQPVPADGIIGQASKPDFIFFRTNDGYEITSSTPKGAIMASQNAWSIDPYDLASGTVITLVTATKPVAPSMPAPTANPASGTNQTSIGKIILDFSSSSSFDKGGYGTNIDGQASQVIVKKDGTEIATKPALAFGTGNYDINVTFSPAITDPGVYTITFPEGLFSYVESWPTTTPIPAFTLTYTIAAEEHEYTVTVNGGGTVKYGTAYNALSDLPADGKINCGQTAPEKLYFDINKGYEITSPTPAGAYNAGFKMWVINMAGVANNSAITIETASTTPAPTEYYIRDLQGNYMYTNPDGYNVSGKTNLGLTNEKASALKFTFEAEQDVSNDALSILTGGKYLSQSDGTIQTFLMDTYNKTNARHFLFHVNLDTKEATRINAADVQSGEPYVIFGLFTNARPSWGMNASWDAINNTVKNNNGNTLYPDALGSTSFDFGSEQLSATPSTWTWNGDRNIIWIPTTDGTTGIDNVKVAGNNDVEYYNLNGQRVQNPQHGIFIRRAADGRTSKVAIK